VAGAQRELHDVVVTVDQPGHDRAPPQIDHGRARIVFVDAACCANGGDAIAVDRDRSRHGIPRIHGRDRSIVEHQLLARGWGG